MAIRVAHVATGNVGRLALIELITNPQFELTGLCVSTPEKVGKDAGELAGLDDVHRDRCRRQPGCADRHSAGVHRVLRDG